jgi:hypothetical protein
MQDLELTLKLIGIIGKLYIHNLFFLGIRNLKEVEAISLNLAISREILEYIRTVLKI